MTARQLTQIVGCGFAAALTAASLLVATSVLAQDSGAKPASDATRAANAKLLNELPFANTQEFEDAKAGFIAPLPDNGVIRNDKGETIYDLSKFTAFIAEGKGAPDTVNPSLWRQSQLLMLGGLFKVADGIYQVRAADLSNITFIEAPDGLVVVDPLISAETAKYALEELREGVKKLGAPSTASPDTIRAMDLDLLFDYAAMRLNGPKAEGKSMKFNWSFTDTN